jgi:5-methylcytosine-specific restriction endonuclease McrA
VSTEDFQYTIDRIRSQFSKAELTASLQEYSRVHKTHSFGMRNYDNWSGRLATSDTIRRYFGTWGKALQAAGFRTVRGQKLDPKDMVAVFKACWKKNGSVPSQRQLEVFLEKENCPFRYKSYLNFFGGLGRLAKCIAQVQRGELPEARLYEKHSSKVVFARTVSLRDRHIVLKRDGYQCVKCGASPRKDRSVILEVDHVISVARGGSSKIENLQTLCFACNQGKKDRDD